MKQLFYSPLSGNIYFGNDVPLKTNPDVSIIRGEKTDVTQSFHDVLFKKYPPGFEYEITVNGKPQYKVTVELVNDFAPEGV